MVYFQHQQQDITLVPKSLLLAKLSLPTFSSDPGRHFGIHSMLQSQSQWDTEVQLSQAQLQGDAARVIGRLPLSDLNYRHAITLL